MSEWFAGTAAVLQPGAVDGRRYFWPVAIAVAALLSACAWLTATDTMGLFHDDGIYAVTAKSLAEGHGYRILSLPGDPIQTKYPVVYPFLLSLVWRVAPDFPSNVVWLKSLGVVSLGATVLLSAGLLRRWTRYHAPHWVLAFSVIVGLNPLVFSTTDLTLSDGLFAALTAAVLLVHADGTSARGLMLTCGAAALSAVAMQTRQVGVAFVAAGLVWAWPRGRWHVTAYLGVVLSTLLADAALRGAGHEPSSNLLLNYYTGYETPLFARLLSSPGALWNVVSGNLGYVFDTADAFLLFGALPGMRWVYVGLIAVGLPETLRRGGLHLAAVLVFYVGLVLVYPFVPTRYLLPLVPVTLVCLCNGFATLDLTIRSRVRSGRPGSLIAGALVALLLLASLAWGDWYRSAPPGNLRLWTGMRVSYGWSGFTETFSWVRQHTRASDVIATAYDPSYYLYTGRQGVRPWLHQPDTYFYPRHRATANIGSAAEILVSLDALGVDYLVLDPLDGFAERDAAQRLFEELLRRYGPRAELTFESADHRHRIYRIAPGA